MAYIGTQPKDVRSFGKAKFDFTATQGQTAFTGADDDGKTLGFTDGQINVYVNGILMDDSDYSTSGSNTVTLSAAANANDIISVVALQTDIPNSDYVPATGGTFSGTVNFDGSVLTKNENGGELQLLNNSGAVKGLIDFGDYDSDGEGQLRFLNLSTDDGGVQIGIAQSNSVGNISLVTNNQERLRINPDGTTVVRQYLLVGEASNGDFQGITIRNAEDSGTVNKISFVDAQNNLAVADAHMFFEHQTDGGSNIIFGTTPAGDRSTDRRVERMRINSAGYVTMPYQPAFYAYNLNFPYQTAGFAVGGGVMTNIGSGYNGTTGRFTAPVTGTYVIHVMTQYYSDGSSTYQTAAIYKNGSSIGAESWHGHPGSTGNYHAQANTCVIVTLNANDYVQAYTHYGSRDIQNLFCGYLLG